MTDRKILLENKMFHAAAGGHYQKLKELITEGVDVNAISTIKKVYILPGQTALMTAAWKGRLDCMKVLVEQGADVNYVASFTTTHSLSGYEPTQRKSTALIDASTNPDALECAKYLIEQGADINFQDQAGKTALMHAISRGIGNDFILYLLESGSDLTVEDQSGKTVIQIVSESGNDRVLQLITAFKEKQALKEQLKTIDENNGIYFNI